MKIKEIINVLEELAPPEYTLDWDNSGLQLGNISKELIKIGIALTPTVKIIQEAVEKGCNLLITHHPLIFKPLRKIDTKNPIGKCIEMAIKNDMTIYTMHTNFDSSSNGLNYIIAKDLGLDNMDVLEITKNIELFKLAAFVPEEYTLKVINAISDAGAGKIGKLTHCSYITAGIATFVNESSGEENFEIPAKEPEDRFEIIVPKTNLENVINKLREVHPYKDFVYDIYKLEDKSLNIGIGTIGEFFTPFPLSEVIDMVKRNLHIPNLQYVGNPNKVINKVAICTGSGGSMLNIAKAKGADLLITGDIKYHTAIDAKEIDISVIDAGHYFTEIISVPFIYKFLKTHFENNIEVVELIEENPFSHA